MRRLLPIITLLGLCLSLMLGALLCSGAAQAWGQEEEKAAPKPGPVLEVKIKEEPAAVKHSLALDPFYLIEEEASRVRVRRIELALEFAQPELMKQVDPQASRLREQVYDFLISKERNFSGLAKTEQEKALAAIVNRCLGQEAVAAVKVDQNILLLR